jgi:hypothetical protein
MEPGRPPNNHSHNQLHTRKVPIMHPATQAILSYFSYDHLPPGQREVSQIFSDLAGFIAENLDGPEATVALRKLLESKDAAVRASLELGARP